MEKSELVDYRILAREVQQLRDQLTALEAAMYSPGAIRYTNTPSRPSGGHTTLDNVVAQHMELVERYQRSLAEKEAQQLVIEQAIDSLEDPGERFVMRERYINGRSWAAICSSMQKLGYSERKAYRLHGFALLKLKEV